MSRIKLQINNESKINIKSPASLPAGLRMCRNLNIKFNYKVFQAYKFFDCLSYLIRST